MHRWDLLRSSLDWTRYHLDVVFIEGGGTGDARIAGGLFERIARFHSCSGALPADLGTVQKALPILKPEIASELQISPSWLNCDVETFDTLDLKFYDVVVCVDSMAADILRAGLRNLGEDAFPKHVIELNGFGAYLEFRRPESPMKAWVPDWRTVMDPDYDKRQVAASAPFDDALAVWKELPEDLAQIIQPHYETITSFAIDKSDTDTSSHAKYDHALLAFHVGGLVRFLMDSYPLDLQGGPGYCGPP